MRVCFVFLVLIASTSFDATSQVEKLDVNWKSVETIDFDMFIDSVRYIPLETDSTCLIGYVDKIIRTKDRYFILDKRTSKSVFVFSREGKFLFKIYQEGKGPGEYRRIEDLVVNEESGEIIIMCEFKDKDLFFDWDGKFIDYKNVDIDPEQGYWMGSDCYVLSTGDECNRYLGNLDYDLTFMKGDKIVKQWRRTDRFIQQVPIASINLFCGVNKKFLFHANASDTIFEIDGLNVYAKYVINSTGHRVDLEKIRHLVGRGGCANTPEFGEFARDMTRNGLFYSVMRLGETSDCLFFTTIAAKGKIRYFLHDKKTKKSFTGIEVNTSKIIGINNYRTTHSDCMIFYVDAYAFLDYRKILRDRLKQDEILEEDIKYNSLINQLEVHENDNPVLMEVKFKSSIDD